MRADVTRGQRRNLVLSPEVVALVCVKCRDTASLSGRFADSLLAGSVSISCVGGSISVDRNTCASENCASSAVEVRGAVEYVGPLGEGGVGWGDTVRRFLSLAPAGVGICCLS